MRPCAVKLSGDGPEKAVSVPLFLLDIEVGDVPLVELVDFAVVRA